MASDIAGLVVSVSSKGVKSTTEELKKLDTQSATTEKSAVSLGKAIGSVGAAFLGGSFLKAIIDNTIESENALTQLNATLKSTGGAAGMTSDEIVAMAQGLQKVTTFGDDAIIAMESQLLTFTKLGRDVVPAATEAILDLATKMGGDLKGATVQIGKALNDPITGITALTKVGVTFNDAQKETIKTMVEMGDIAGAQTLILQELQTEFGGSARAARDTFGGAIIALQNTFGDLLEGSGGNLTEAKVAVEGLTEALSDPRVQAAFGTIVAGVLNVTSAIAKAMPEFLAFTRWAAEDLAAAFNGAAIGDIVRLEDELSSLESQLADVQDAWTTKPSDVTALQAQIAETKQKIAITNEMAAADAVAAAAQAKVAAEQQAAAKEQAALRAKQAADMIANAASAKLASEAEKSASKAEAEAKKQAAAAIREKAAALKEEKKANDLILAGQAETVRRMADEQASKDSNKALLGQVDPITGENQKFQKEMDDLRLLNANKLLEDQRYLDLKTQAETAHDEQLRVLQEENFRRQSAGNELLMASLDQLQVGATNALVGLATGASNSEDAIQALASSILNEGVGALVQMGVQTLKNMVMGQAAQTAATATSVTAAITTAAAWQPAAIAASIGSFGAAPAAGLASMASSIPAMHALMSFDGGGFTGSGSRSGGMDGKGGFPAMLHPNETVIDHTKGQSMGGGVTVNVIESSEKAGTQEKTTGADGSETVSVFVADIYGDGPMSQAIKSKFGLSGVGK